MDDKQMTSTAMHESKTELLKKQLAEVQAENVNLKRYIEYRVSEKDWSWEADFEDFTHNF
jgi:hypothetical protein